jgi:hypothetical protein
MQSLDVVLSTLAIVLFVSPIAIALFLIGLDLPRRWKTLRWRPFRLILTALLLGGLAVGMHSHVQDVCANGPSSSSWFVIAVVCGSGGRSDWQESWMSRLQPVPVLGWDDVRHDPLSGGRCLHRMSTPERGQTPDKQRGAR